MLEIRPVTLPDTHTDPGWAAYCRLLNANERELIGGPQWDIDPAVHLESLRADPDTAWVRLEALVDGSPAGFLHASTDLADAPDSATVTVFVLPELRGRGIATALIEAYRSKVPGTLRRVRAWVEAPVRPDADLRPMSGHGAVDARNPGVRLALKHGLTLGVVERVSRYDFGAPLVDPAEAVATAAAVAGDDYEVRAWEGESPDEFLPGLARLKERMAVDQPSGGLEVVEQSWDVDRVRERERLALVGYRLFRTVAIHRPTGEVAATSVLSLSRSNPEAFLDQGDTIVLAEHRGRRLGMLVKGTNLVQVARLVPDATGIVTWNAAENRPMLAVNEALGFHPILTSGGFELIR